MTLTADNVRVAVSGAVYIAPHGSTAPTDATTAPAAAFKDLGYVSEDGVVEARDRSTNDIIAWQNSDKVRTVVTEAGMTLTLTLIETKTETVEAYYGTALQADGSITIVPSETGGRQAFIFDVVDGTDVVRTYVPSGEITEVGELTNASGDPVGYEITISCYPDASITDADTGKPGSARKWYDVDAIPTS